MLTIEYVHLRDKEKPIVIEKTTLGGTPLAAAESVAEATLADLRQNRPETGPHGYQIRDEHDKIILRSWDRRALIPKGPRGEKRPADVVARAVKVMRIATGEEKEATEKHPQKGASGKSRQSKKT